MRGLSTPVIEKRTCTVAEAEAACASIAGCRGFAYSAPEDGGYAASGTQSFEVKFFGSQLVCSWFGGSQNLCLRLQTDEDTKVLLDGICESKGRALHHPNTSKWLVTNRELMTAAVKLQPGLLTHVDPSLRKDRDVALAAIAQSETAVEDVNGKLWDDTRFVESMLKKDGLNLRRATEAIQADRGTVLLAVSQNGEALKWASTKLRNDKEVVKAAVSQRVEAFQYAHDNLRGDAAFVQELLRFKTVTLQYAADSLRNDPVFMLKLIRSQERCLEYASDALRQDKEFIRTIIEEQGDAIRHAWPTIWEDAELMLLATKNDKKAIRHAGKAAWDNKEFVLRMVKESWKYLERVSPELRNDKEVAKVAIKQTPEALKFLGDELREDPEICYLVYKEDEETAVKYARSEVFAERDFCFAVAGKKVPKEWGLTPGNAGA